MPLSRAEIQKSYRERKKQREGETYLQKERKRRMTYYVPAAELRDSERKKRNAKTNVRVRRSRQKKKEAALREEQRPNDSPPTSGYESNIISPSNEEASESGNRDIRMIVNLKFNKSGGTRIGSRKRISRALSKANREIKQLQSKNENLKKKIKTMQKQNQRRIRKVLDSPKTPKSQAEKDLIEAGLSPRRSEKVRRKLQLGNALLSEIKDAKTKAGTSKKRKEILESIASGSIIRKYRGLKWLAKGTGLNRNKLGRVASKWVNVSKKSRKRKQQMYGEVVRTFLERDDNSRAQPGKADVKKTDSGDKIQTRVLTDYLSNLYQKLLSENPKIVISFATFCRMRPSYILTTSLITRSTCLCTRHQNMALLLRALRKEGVDVPQNPESFLKSNRPTTEEIQQKLPEKVSVSQWKRTEVNDKGRSKNVMRILEVQKDKKDFVSMMEDQIKEFEEHVDRVKKQYDEIKRLKEHLPNHHFILHMDFAENFTCKSHEEIQSAYWNQTGVTLHPVVVYFSQEMNGEKKLEHKSFVVISDELSHSTPTVHAILDKLIPLVKEIDPEAEMVHYWTDGPTSQYRNKQIFCTVANHFDIYGLHAKWNYFEVGHGKGPCDGLGGTTKRMADEAIRSGRAVIQDSVDFYKWSIESNMKGVKFIYVSSEECQKTKEMLNERKVSPLHGTFKLHAVIGLGDSTVAFRDVSCYCTTCLNFVRFCEGWKTQKLIYRNVVSNDTAILRKNIEITANDGSISVTRSDLIETPHISADSEHDVRQTENEAVGPSVKSTVRPCVNEGDYIAATYGNSWYIGKVLQIDEDDGEVEVAFLQKKKQLFQWPERDDIIWISPENIICKVSELTATGKSKRMLKLDELDRDNIRSIVGQKMCKQTSLAF